MSDLQKFDFVHLLNESLVYHAEVKNKVCNVVFLNDGEKKTVTYSEILAKEYIEKGLWIIKEEG